MEYTVSAIDDRNPWLAADLRDAANQQHLVAALTLARAEADRANLAKSRLLASASRDLHQPLHSLSLLNSTLRRMVAEPHAADALRQQEQAILAMSRLVDTLLEISELESRAIGLEPTDFTRLFREACSDLNLAANNELLPLVGECPVRARTTIPC